MSKSYLFSGELAKIIGVSTDTLRYYERKGVLEKPPRSAKGYRLYPKNAIEKVKLIRSALSIGFGINELATIFEQQKNGKPPCREVREFAAHKLLQVEKKLKDLSVFREELQTILKDWDKDLSKLSVGESANLLKKLAESKNDFTQTNSSNKLLSKEF